MIKMLVKSKHQKPIACSQQTTGSIRKGIPSTSYEFLMSQTGLQKPFGYIRVKSVPSCVNSMVLTWHIFLFLCLLTASCE